MSSFSRYSTGVPMQAESKSRANEEVLDLIEQELATRESQKAQMTQRLQRAGLLPDRWQPTAGSVQGSFPYDDASEIGSLDPSDSEQDSDDDVDSQGGNDGQEGQDASDIQEGEEYENHDAPRPGFLGSSDLASGLDQFGEDQLDEEV